MSDKMSMNGSESESDDEIIVFKKPLTSISSSAASKSPKRKLARTQIIKSKPSTGTAISSGIVKRKRPRKVKSRAMDEAERIRSGLNSAFPSFAKHMVKSCVEGARSMFLSFSFSDLHLPKEETMITLEDEKKKKFPVQFLPKWSVLSAGWSKFAVAHELCESDVLLFHLVEPGKFKVYIIKAYPEDVVLPRILNLEDEEGGSKLSDDPTDPSEDPEDPSELSSSEEHYQKSPKRKLSQTQNPKSNPSTGTAISSGKIERFRKVKSGAMDEVERIRLSLNSEFPSFIKYMSKSFIEGHKCMLPLSISGSHLPKEETMITLEDENNKKLQVKYIPNGSYLSGGWRNFAVVQKLRESDVLLFHLVEPNRFKVYIIKAHSEVDVIPRTLNLDEEEGGSKSSDDPADHSEDPADPSEDPEDPSADLPTFEEFRRRFNGGLQEESSLEENTLKKYYKLCRSKNSILHDKSFSDRNSHLKAGVISDIIAIANSVKTCSILTPREKLEEWKNSLKSFKILGMKVEFLVNRVNQLMKLINEYERTRFEDELKKLEVQRVAMKEAYAKHCNNIDKMKSKAAGHKVKFQELLDSPL